MLPLLVFLSISVNAVSSAGCGYDACPKPKPGHLNVHLVPHTHDDVGWLKTVDQYFYGDKNSIQNAGVQYIIDSVIPALVADPTKRFIYVESAFFWRWWGEQGEPMRSTVRGLVSEGRLEFIGGGWSMNDEAAAHYNAIIDNMALGLQFLNETFGECGRPRVAWQIDPFGHAREQANLFAQMGFDGLFFGRLDYDDKKTRMRTKTMEMVWKGSDVQGNSSWLFTGALFNGYGPPKGFCFDIFCDDEPIMDDPRMHDNNVGRRVGEFLSEAREWGSAYGTNNIIMTMGSDFNYQNANTWYKNLDKLIKYVNSGLHDRQSPPREKPVHAFYSTPSCYLKALHEAERTWPTKSDDFFPYASDPHAFWTGYFTSRPAFKGMIRRGNNLLQVCKQMSVLSGAKEDDGIEEKVDAMRRVMGVMQHHDAVTGTAKQAVTFDYQERLAEGFSRCESVVDAAYKNMIAAKERTTADSNADANVVVPKQEFCRLLNLTQCHVSESSPKFVVTAYNPLVRPVDRHIRIPIVSSGYDVFAPDGAKLVAQTVPISRKVLMIPGRQSKARFELVFKAAGLPALGFKSFYVQRNPSASRSQMSILSKIKAPTFLSSGRVAVETDARGGLSRVITEKGAIGVKQHYGYYEGHDGRNTFFADRASGAYIFRPKTQNRKDFRPKAGALLYEGPLFQEVQQEFSEYVSQSLRLYNDSADVQVDWLVGPIPVKDRVGKEVVVVYETTLKSGDKFMTDSNGRQLLERTRNHRPTWKLNLTEAVSANYYPVNSNIAIRDSAKKGQVTVLTDRSQGGTSMASGEVELMLHRRLLHDDAFGVGEPLDEVAFGQGLVVRGTEWLQVEADVGKAARRQRLGAQQAFMDAELSFAEVKMSHEEYRRRFVMEKSHAKSRLTDNVHLLTLEKWRGKDDAVLVRLEHIFDDGEDAELSKLATLDLGNLLEGVKVLSAEELALGANMRMTDLHRLQWKVHADNEIGLRNGGDDNEGEGEGGPLIVKLRPMQIRTFALTVER